MANLNYATEYSQALAGAYPYALYFGALYGTPNNNRYRFVDARTIAIPSISTTGRVDADRDTIATAQRNYNNAWENKTLTHQRQWSTLVHPKDIDQTNHVASIANITAEFNQNQKFPEMDAYTVSQLYKLWTEQSMTADKTALSASNILAVFDSLMEKMDEKRVPVTGRILYVPVPVKTMLKNAAGMTRNFDVKTGGSKIDRSISRIEEVEIVGVPSELMKTKYDFTAGYKVDSTAKQINMFLVHPSAVITPVSYESSSLDEPRAITGGKWLYYEESHEDVFILNKRADALQFNVEA